MNDIEQALVEKIVDKIDMDLLTDRIAEKVADRVMRKEFPAAPPVPPGMPWTTPVSPLGPLVLMYGCTPTVYSGELDDICIREFMSGVKKDEK